MGDMADMLNDSMMLDDDTIEEIDSYLLEGDENFSDYVYMSQSQQRGEMTSLRNELHNPPKDNLDMALEQSRRVMIVGIDKTLEDVVKKFGKPYKNAEEIRARLNMVENQVKELTQEKEFLKQQLDNWTGENETCPKCGKAMAKRNGKFGEFWGCTGFPQCNGTRKI